MVVPEGGSLLYMNETMILDGHTGVEHSLPVPKLYKDVVTLFAKSKTGYTPTLIVGYGGLFGRELLVSAHERVGERAAPGIHAARDRRCAVAAPADGAGRRLQPRAHCQGSEADPGCRRFRPARRARAAPGPGRALGAVDAAAGRDDQSRGDPVRHDSTARNTSASTRSSGRSRRASSPI